GFLRFVQRAGIIPVAACVSHPLIEHVPEKFVAQVIMLFTYFPGLGASLVVYKTGTQNMPESGGGSDLVIDAMAQQAGDPFINLVAFPLPIHIPFARPHAPMRKNAVCCFIICEAKVPRRIAVDRYTCRCSKFALMIQGC